MPRHEAILSLGSNQGQRQAWLAKAVKALSATPGITVLELSAIYESAPVDVVPEDAHKMFFNQIAIVASTLDVMSFSDTVHAIETRLGRVRRATRNQPRTIDIDIIAFDTLRLSTLALTLPHPRAIARRFVLLPLAELRPDLTLPGQKHTVTELLLRLPTAAQVVRIAKIPAKYGTH